MRVKYSEFENVVKSRSKRLPKETVYVRGNIELSSDDAWQLYKCILCRTVGNNEDKIERFLHDFVLAYENYYRVLLET